MHKIKINNISLELPSAQQEASLRDAELISAFLFSEESIELKSWLVVKMLSQRLRPWRRGLLRRLDPAQLLELSELLGWIWQGSRIETGRERLDPWIPSFKHKGRKYLLPKQGLSDVTAEEFSWIDLYLRGVAQDQPEALSLLVATVCRPARPQDEIEAEDWDGFERVYFNADTIQRRAEELQGLPAWVALVVLDYCSRAQAWIAKRYPALFSGESSGGEGFGWMGLIMSLAEAGALGNEQQIRRAPLHQVCIYATKKIFEQREQERAHEEQMRKIKQR